MQFVLVIFMLAFAKKSVHIRKILPYIMICNCLFIVGLMITLFFEHLYYLWATISFMIISEIWSFMEGEAISKLDSKFDGKMNLYKMTLMNKIKTRLTGNEYIIH